MRDGNKTIIVDFKFGKPHPEHHNQVRQYMQLLNNMQDSDSSQQVEGYLWYVYPNKIVKVEA